MVKVNRKRVLVVDDEPNVALVLAEALEGLYPAEECEFITARNVTQALAQAEHSPVDLLITDFRMPDANGLALIKKLRQKSPEMAAILITAHASEHLKQQAQEAGVNQFMHKPFRVDDIRQVVREILARLVQPHTSAPLSEALQAEVKAHLQELAKETNARGVLLLRTDGNVVDTAGNLGGLDIPVMATLMAANFAAVTEIARLMGNPRSFDAINHESQVDNIYACAVGDQHLLVVIYGLSVKSGIVLYFTKKVVPALANALQQLESWNETQPAATLLPALNLDSALDDALFG